MRTTSSPEPGCKRSSAARRTTSANRGSPLSAAARGVSVRVHDDAVDELSDRPLLDALLSERGKDVRDVVHEGRIRPDDEHPAKLRAMGEEEVGGTVEPDGGLAGAGSSLDDERGERARGR